MQRPLSVSALKLNVWHSVPNIKYNTEQRKSTVVKTQCSALRQCLHNDNRRLKVLELSTHVLHGDALPARKRCPLEQHLHDLLGALKADVWPTVMRLCARQQLH